MAYVEKKRTKFLGLPWCFTTYFVEEEKLTIKRGLFTQIEDDSYMYKIQDVRLTRTLMERMFGLGTVTCYTGDTTHPELKLIHIKNSAEIKDYIRETSEKARLKRRTVQMMDINADIDVEDIGE